MTVSRTARTALASIALAALVALVAAPAGAGVSPPGTAKSLAIDHNTGAPYSTVATRQWSSGWTSQVTYRHYQKNYVFLLKASNGHAKVRQLTDDGNVSGAEIQNEYFDTGWTHAAVVRDQIGQLYVTLYDASKGYLSAKPVNDDGTVEDLHVWGFTFGKGFTSVTSDGRHIVGVNALTGDAQVARLDWCSATAGPGCHWATYVPTQTTNVGPGWTTAHAFTTHQHSYLLLLNKTTGDTQTRDLHSILGAQGTIGSVVGNTRVRPGFTMAATYATNRPMKYPDGSVGLALYHRFVLLYDKATGSAEVHELNANLTVGDATWQATWNRGWTSAGVWWPTAARLAPYLFLVTA